MIAACCITLSFFIDLYWSGNSSVTAVKEKIEQYVQQQERAFDRLLKDTGTINKIADNRYDEHLLEDFREKKYFFYRYFVNDIGLYHLIFWNSQSVLPSTAVMESHDSTGFVKLPNGFYVWRKSVTAKSITVALIPIKWNYIITNEYLENTFVAGQGIENNYDISTKSTTASVRYITVERDVEGGAKEVVQMMSPSSLSANKGLNLPRYASLPGIMKAKKKVVKELEISTLGITTDAKVKYAGYTLPADKSPVKMLVGDASAQSSELVKLLRDEAKVL